MKKYLLFLLLSIYSISSFAQYKLILQYDSPTTEVKNLLSKIKIKKNYSSVNAIEKDLSKMRDFFFQHYYTAFSIDTLMRDSFTYTAYLFFGNPFIINNITIEGLDKNSINGLKQPATPLNIQNVLKYAENIIQHLENNGYPFSAVTISYVEEDSSHINAILNVEQNNHIVWDSIIIKGNAKLSKNFLYSFFNIKAGKDYEEKTARQIPDLIQELPYVVETHPASFSFGKDKAALYLYLDKKNTNQFDGFIGIIPVNDKSGKTLITGNLNLLLNNTMTLGESISLQWKNPDKLSQDLNIALTFPYLFRTQFGLNFDFHLQKKDTSYLYINFSPALQYYFKGSNYLAFYYRYNNARLIATQHLQYAIALPEQIDFDLHLYGLEFLYRKLDYIFNPRRGYSLLSSVAIGRRNIIVNNNIPKELYTNIAQNTFHVKSMGSVSFYLPIKKRWTWLNRLEGAYMHGKNLFENELFRIGGLNTLRGFIEQSIYASSYALLTTEIRFLFTKNSFINVFLDAGWYEKKYEGAYLHDFPFGFGLGTAFDSKVGIFSINYALGRQMDNPIRFKTGVLSFGYIAVF